MSADPMKKGGASEFSDPIPNYKGSINTNKDYYSSTSSPARTIFVGLCALP